MTLGIIARGLGIRGHEITVYRPHRDDLPTPEVERAYQQVTMPGFRIPGYQLLRFGWPARRSFCKFWHSDRPDLVHVVTEGPLGASAVSAARALGIAVTSSFHTNFHAYTKNYGFSLLNRVVLNWLRWVHNRTQRTFAPTDQLCGELRAMGFNNLALLSRGIDLACFNPDRRCEVLRSQWGVQTDDRVVLHVGRMAPEKNYELLFRIFADMWRVDPDLKFVVAGDGPLKDKLRKEHPECIFTGFFSREEIGRHYASADIYIHPSLTETFGNVLTEALASGLAVAGFDYAAARQFVKSEENGLLAPYGDEDALLKQSLRLAGDRRLTDRLKGQARTSIVDHSWDQVIDRFNSDLSEAAKERREG